MYAHSNIYIIIMILMILNYYFILCILPTNPELQSLSLATVMLDSDHFGTLFKSN